MNITSPISVLKKEKYAVAFLLGFISFILVILPIIIYNGGYYIYYGDYNAQQIPFYVHSQDFVKNEGLGWDWGTDLGANFLGSYAFYLLGSPFFWLSLPFPNSFVVFLMPILLALKFGVASMTAYAYIKRFVRSRNASLIGGMLYAFSGFQMFNIFFNHFHDVTAFFPLMLIAMEERINNNRRGVFAVSVALMGIISYFFFAGQVVFLVIYLLVRLGSPDFRITWKKFFSLAIEAVLGVMIACVMLLPAALAILGNYRINERLYGLNIVTYNDRTIIPRIIQSFFMIPDVPARPNLFSSDSAKWSSIGGYLPLFSMAGVITFFKSRKKHWAKKIIIICMICAFVPILNSMFYTFNSAYYARWYYMPILIMAMMTAQAFDDYNTDFKYGIKASITAIMIFLLISFLPTKSEDDKVEWFSMPKYPEHFILVTMVCLISLVILWFIVKERNNRKSFMKITLISTVVCCIASMACVEYFGATLGDSRKTYINNGINGAENISLEKEENQFYRIDISENYDNYPMFWGMSSMRAFQSVVPGSIMQFYDEIDVARDVASRVPLEKYTLRGLFSVKYYFDKVDNDKKDEYTYKIDLPGFKFLKEENGFYIYENEYYIPMGFSYDYYIEEKENEIYINDARDRILTTAIVLNEKQAEKYSDIMTVIPKEKSFGFNTETYLEDCKERAKESCSSFIYDSDGFDAKITLDRSKLVFFSVPYDKGWTAYVNGKPVDVEEVSYGFMAVKGEEGENEIEFRYETPGLKYGMIISLCGIALTVLYLFITRKTKCDTSNTYYYDYEEYQENIEINE